MGLGTVDHAVPSHWAIRVWLSIWFTSGMDTKLPTAVHTEGFCADWGPADMLRSVPCVTLDSLADREGVPDFVKIDTEGGEAAVLQGMTGLLAGRKPSLVIEFHSASLRAECLAILEAAGYAAQTVRAPHLAAGSHFWLGYGWLKAVPEEGS